MNESLLSYVDVMSILTLFVSLFYAFQNYSLKKHKSKANRLFTYYLLNFSVFVFFFFLIHIKLVIIVKYMIPLLMYSVLMLPAMLWMYQKQLVSGRLNKGNLIHYIFPLLFSGVFLILSLIMMFSSNPETVVSVFSFLHFYIAYLFTSAFVVQNGIYITLFVIKLLKHRRNIQNYYSYTEKINLNWLLFLIIGYFLLVVGIISCEFIFEGFWSDVVFYSTLSIYVAFTGHQALHQKEIEPTQSSYKSSPSNDEVSPLDVEQIPEQEEQFSEAQQQLFPELKQKLEAYIQQEKPYLDQELTIFKLAKDLNSNTRYLSHIINKEYQQNFIHFINEFRIAEVKKNLLDQQKSNYTIEALAQHAGFKSKSSFNAAFKKSTGKTPSDFMREHLN